MYVYIGGSFRISNLALSNDAEINELGEKITAAIRTVLEAYPALRERAGSDVEFEIEEKAGTSEPDH